MNTLVLNADTANLPIENLLNRVKDGGLTVQDSQGNVVAFVLSPADHEAWTYAEGHLDLDQHLEQVRRSLGRRDGITTAELLARAASAAERASQ